MSMIESAAAPAKCPPRNLVSNVVLGESNERYLERSSDVFSARNVE